MDLLAERGLVYDASLMGDDIPYVLNTSSGDLVTLPAQWCIDDWPHYAHNMEFDDVPEWEDENVEASAG